MNPTQEDNLIQSLDLLDRTNHVALHQLLDYTVTVPKPMTQLVPFYGWKHRTGPVQSIADIQSQTTTNDVEFLSGWDVLRMTLGLAGCNQFLTYSEAARFHFTTALSSLAEQADIHWRDSQSGTPGHVVAKGLSYLTSFDCDEAVARLFAHREYCNNAAVEHPLIPVADLVLDNDTYTTLSLLGVLQAVMLTVGSEVLCAMHSRVGDSFVSPKTGLPNLCGFTARSVKYGFGVTTDGKRA